MFEVAMLVFLIFGWASLWLLGGFLNRLREEFPVAWERAGRPGMITLLFPVSHAEFLDWQRAAHEDGLRAEMLHSLRRGWLFSLLALVAFFLCIAALLPSLSAP